MGEVIRIAYLGRSINPRSLECQVIKYTVVTFIQIKQWLKILHNTFCSKPPYQDNYGQNENELYNVNFSFSFFLQVDTTVKNIPKLIYCTNFKISCDLTRAQLLIYDVSYERLPIIT